MCVKELHLALGLRVEKPTVGIRAIGRQEVKVRDTVLLAQRAKLDRVPMIDLRSVV